MTYNGHTFKGLFKTYINLFKSLFFQEEAAAPTINTQPAIMKPTEEPPAYSQPQSQVRYD